MIKKIINFCNKYLLYVALFLNIIMLVCDIIEYKFNVVIFLKIEICIILIACIILSNIIRRLVKEIKSLINIKGIFEYE